jgi:hypothetical protein
MGSRITVNNYIVNLLGSIRKMRSAWLVMVLFAQNLLMFRLHYFGGGSFTGDFTKTYHAVVYNWMEMVKCRVDTTWVPFAGMGYPLEMNLQSGLYYPVFMLFSLMGCVYSVYSAIVIQCAHVLFGAIGAMLASKGFGMRWRASLFSGLAYQSFGCFVLNSMHPDIIRSFALIPWLCVPVFAKWKHPSLLFKWMCVFQPVIVYMFWTGGYVGLTISTLFVFGLVVLFKAVVSRDLRFGAVLLLSYVAGTLLASVAILPPIIQSAEIARSSVGNIQYDLMRLRDLGALVFRTDTGILVGHDPSMRSMYIGVPAVLLIVSGFSCAFKANKWLWFLVGVSWMMASGQLLDLVKDLVPSLGYSRFIFSDYKAMICLPLIFMASYVIDCIELGVCRPNMVAVFVACIAIVWVNFAAVGPSSDSNWLILNCATCLVLIFFLGRSGSFVAVFLLMIMVGVDWGRVHWRSESFLLEGGQRFFNDGALYQQPPVSFGVYQNALRNELLNPPEQRSARLDVSEFGYCWRGYYSGEYLVRDWSGPMQYKRHRMILADSVLLDFAKQEWGMRLVESNGALGASVLPIAVGGVRPLRYKTNRLEYALNLNRNAFLVENEIYWLGWRCFLRNEQTGEVRVILPREFNGFRGWEFPAGNWFAVEVYTPPYRRVACATTCLGVVILILNGFLFLRRPENRVDVNRRVF